MKYTLAFGGLTLVALGLILVTFVNTLPLNPLKIQLPFKKETFTFVPQGWAFFTRSPREAQVLAYHYTAEGTLVPVTHQHASPANAFGLNRRSTQIMSELQLIKSKLPDSVFMDSRWNYQRQLYGSVPESSISVKNEFNGSVLCGTYVLVFQEMVPWAWAQAIETIKMPAKVVRLNIDCQRD